MGQDMAAEHSPNTRTGPLFSGYRTVEAYSTGVQHHLTQDLDADPVVLVQTGPTLLHNWDIHNTTAADAFLLCYNAAAIGDVTVGTTVPDYIVPSGANAIVDGQSVGGIKFVLGLCIASTTTTNGSTDAAQDVSLGFA